MEMIAAYHAARSRRSKWAARLAIFAVGLLAMAYAASY